MRFENAPPLLITFSARDRRRVMKEKLRYSPAGKRFDELMFNLEELLGPEDQVDLLDFDSRTITIQVAARSGK
jgi:hypothetical protein